MHLRRRIAIILSVAGAAATAHGSNASADTPAVFPEAAFERNLATAVWMTDYDRRARLTFDLVMKKGRAAQLRLSPVWFCLQRGGTWWAVYGRMSEGAFTATAVFEETERDHFTDRTGVIDPQFDTLARALADAQRDIESAAQELGIRFNYYVRAADGGIEVWALPAYQRNGVVGYGHATLCAYDRHATRRVRKTSFGAAVRGVRANPDLDFTLTNHDDDVPSVANIYIVLNHRRRFRSLVIQTVHFLSTAVDSDRGPVWRHTPW